MEPISIAITDDHRLIREAWAMILNTDVRLKVLATFGSTEEMMEQCSKLKPDVIILDINLPGINGIDAIPLIKKISPASKILGVSLHTQPSYVKRMMNSGASGYITKNSSKEEMVKAVIEVYNNHKYICNEIKTILAEFSLYGDESNHGINTLSEREIEVAQLVKQGLSSKQIADQLFLSVKTVEVHRSNILKKLKLKNTAALVNFISTQSEFD